jgi:Uncharacterised nucleotidyltransferase
VRLSKRGGTFLPTVAQHHLLRAALLRDRQSVVRSLGEWGARVAIDDVDFGSLRLLPLLYTNLRRHEIGHESMPRLRGLYRKSWLRNTVVFEHGLRALRSLRAAGVDSILLKGAALSVVYEDPAQRPMEDIDVLVRSGELLRAIDRLEEVGWRPVLEIGDPEAFFAFRHSVGFRNGVGELDLHKAPFRESFPPELEDGLWSASEPTTIDGEEVRVLAPADQLLQVCAHASLRNANIPPIRWAADVWFVLAAAGVGFDWDRLVEQAGRLSCSFVLLRCLAYLRDGLDVDVPADALLALRGDSTLRNRVALRISNAEGRANYLHLVLRWTRLLLDGSLRDVPRRLRDLRHSVRAQYRIPPGTTIGRFAMTRLLRSPNSRRR